MKLKRTEPKVTSVSVTRHVSQSNSFQSVGASMTMTADVGADENPDVVIKAVTRKIDERLATVAEDDHRFIMHLAKANKYGRK